MYSASIDFDIGVALTVIFQSLLSKLKNNKSLEQLPTYILIATF
ncbi:MAG: hypothetical protein HNEKOMLI_00895 [Sodalis sp. Psp]|nr:hypothetical protein [Sodalis sp. Psp]MCR3757354.1 hypothetical protein [Sodalis sp. Ppy]